MNTYDGWAKDDLIARIEELELKAEALDALESLLVWPRDVTLRFNQRNNRFAAYVVHDPYQDALVGLGIRPREAILALRDKLLEAKRG